MNPEQPSREQIETRITALLLGELPAEEAALLRWTISRDAELTKLHDQLALAIGLVREVAKNPAATSGAQNVPLALAHERRQKLLAHFKTPRPKPSFWLRRIEVPSLIPVLVVVAIVALLAAMLLPALSAAKSKAQRVTTLAGKRVAAEAAVEQSERKLTSVEAYFETSESANSAPALSPPPVVAALPPASTPAPPPPTEIVLPKAEPGQAESENGGVYSQNIVGYVNVQNQYGIPSELSRRPDTETVNMIPQVQNEKTEAATLVRDGKLLYEMGKFDEAEVKLADAVKEDPNNSAAYYYQNLDKQAKYARATSQPAVDTQARIEQVERRWNAPSANPLPAPSVAPATPGDAGAPNQSSSDLAFNDTSGGNNQNGSQVIGVVNAFTGSGALRSPSRGGGGGGGGFGGGGAGGGGGRRNAGTTYEYQNRGLQQPAQNSVPTANESHAVDANGNILKAESATITVDPNTHNIVVVSDSGTANQISEAVKQLDRPVAANNLGVANNGTLVRHGFVGAGPIGSGSDSWQTSGTDGTMDGESSFDRGMLANKTDQPGASGLRQQQPRGTSSPEAVTRLDLQGGVALDQSQLAGDKAPVLGDVPVLGRMYRQKLPGVSAAAAETAPETQRLLQTERAKETSQSSAGYLALNSVNSFDGTTVNAGTMTVNGNNNYINGTTLNQRLQGQNAPINLNIENGDATENGSRDQKVFAFHMNNGDPQQAVQTLQNMFQTTQSRNTSSASQNSALMDRYHSNEQRASAQTVTSPVSGFSYDTPLSDSLQFTNAGAMNQPAGNITFSPGTSAITASGGAFGVDSGKFYSSLTADDANGVRYKLADVNPATGLPAAVTAEPDVLDSQLNQNGYAAIRDGRTLTIVNKNDAKTREIPVKTGNYPDEISKSAEMVTQIVPVRFVDPRQMVGKLASSVSPQTTIVANESGNSVVITDTQQNVKHLTQIIDSLDVPPRQTAATNALVPQPEILTRENAFSTFSLNVSDVSFKLAAASLEKGQMPEAASIRSEEFINAFDYRDPEASAGQPLAFASERARYPFAQNRDLLRFSVKTAAAGRPAGRALNLVLLLDTSGSMERADRVAIIREAMRVLATQLQPADTVSVVTFARTARLWADGVSGDKAGETLAQVGGITPEGGTNLEEAMRLAYETARRHYLANGMNRVVLLTDGAANLGNVDPGALKQKVEAQRRQGIALDCFGIGWEDFNDNLLEELSGNGDGRYAFINSPEEAGTEFAAKLAGALQVAAQDVKVQVEFNPQRVISWRQIGYAKHQLTKEQFRDNTVLAAEIAAQEAGNALYTVETKPDGIGPVATVYVRYKIPGTENVQEHSWEVPYAGNAVALEQSSAAMRLAATASAFSEWLAASPFAQEVSPDELLKVLSGVPEIYGADSRPIKLATMIREARSIAGK